MVKLTWENKSNISEIIKDSKLRYLDYFETVNLGLGDFQGNEWKNLLFWGENLKVLHYLTNNFSGKIDLIYVDPPFSQELITKLKSKKMGINTIQLRILIIGIKTLILTYRCFVIGLYYLGNCCP